MASNMEASYSSCCGCLRPPFANASWMGRQTWWRGRSLGLTAMHPASPRRSSGNLKHVGHVRSPTTARASRCGSTSRLALRIPKTAPCVFISAGMPSLASDVVRIALAHGFSVTIEDILVRVRAKFTGKLKGAAPSPIQRQRSPARWSPTLDLFVWCIGPEERVRCIASLDG